MPSAERRFYSMRAPESFTTIPYLSYSAFRSFANSSGVMYIGSSDWRERFWATAGSATAFLISAFSLSTIGLSLYSFSFFFLVYF